MKIDPTKLDSVPPHNLQAEEAVQACMIQSEQALKQGLNQLRAKDFFNSSHRQVFEAIQRLHQEGQQVNPITVAHALKDTLKEAQLVITGLLGGSYLVGYFDSYIQIVLDCSCRRWLMRLAEKIYVKSQEDAGGGRELVEKLYEALERKIHLQHIEKALLHMNFHPQEVKELLNQTEEEISWLWEPYIPQGSLILLAGAPKVGKSTWVYHLATSVAKGTPFLDSPTTSCPVLILALEEREQDVRRRLASLTEPDVPLHVHSGLLAMERLGKVEDFVATKGVGLVVVDTLGKLWQVADENDAAQVEEAIKPFLQLARSTGAAVVLIHHLRKTSGEEGMDIRGSTALFASVDNALILKRYGQGEKERLLEAIGRYGFSREVICLDGVGYVKLGSEGEVERSIHKRLIMEWLTDEPQEASYFAEKIGLSPSVVRSVLKRLVDEGEASRIGSGKKGDPYRYTLLAP